MINKNSSPRYSSFLLIIFLFFTICNLDFSKEEVDKIERISIDRFALIENVDILISTITVDPNIKLKNGNLLDKVFGEVTYFLNGNTNSSNGIILINDTSTEIALSINKKLREIHLIDADQFNEEDVDYFIDKLMWAIKWP